MSVCKDCGKRFPGCHPYCKAYLEEREEHARRMEAERKAAEQVSLQIERYESIRDRAGRSMFSRFVARCRQGMTLSRR